VLKEIEPTMVRGYVDMHDGRKLSFEMSIDLFPIGVAIGSHFITTDSGRERRGSVTRLTLTGGLRNGTEVSPFVPRETLFA
jgi:hypothetical protein